MESRISKPSIIKTTILILSCILLALGRCGAPLLMRLYFIHGGNRLWLSSFLQNAGFIFTIVPLSIAYFRCKPTDTKFLYIKSRLFLALATFIGILFGLGSYLYAYGLSRLPLSTSALVIASQLAFTAAFARILVNQKFSFFSINAVVLLTTGAGMLALHTSSDRPEGENNRVYVMGFLMTVAAACLNGFIFPLIELTYIKSKLTISYTLVMEFQMITSFFASVFCLVGMIIAHDFKMIPKEAREFGLGETRYYLVLVFSGVLWQCFTLGTIGVICYGSSLFSGIIIAVLIPVAEVLAVIVFNEKFEAEKGAALLLSFWGFVSYFYGEFQRSKLNNNEMILPTGPTPIQSTPSH